MFFIDNNSCLQGNCHYQKQYFSVLFNIKAKLLKIIPLTTFYKDEKKNRLQTIILQYSILLCLIITKSVIKVYYYEVFFYIMCCTLYATLKRFFTA